MSQEIMQIESLLPTYNLEIISQEANEKDMLTWDVQYEVKMTYFFVVLIVFTSEALYFSDVR